MQLAPFDTPDATAERARPMVAKLPAEYPHFAEFAIEHIVEPGYACGDEYKFGLGLILDGLGQRQHGGLGDPPSRDQAAHPST